MQSRRKNQIIQKENPAMKKYRVQVNGKSYDVAVEEIGESPSLSIAPSKPASLASQIAADQVQPVPAAVGDEVLASPMPGKITSIKVKPGQTVKEGDLILMLEAMKMENEILCGRTGAVKEIRVTENAYVDTGDVLAIIG
jgi:glutaconyl-CoA/methylmalonyl-CoA decarboxylase subunit gamma